MTAGMLASLLALLALPVAESSAVERVLLNAEGSALVEMRTAALIMSGQEGGTLPIAVAAVPDGKACGGADRGACGFTALVEIDGAALLEVSHASPSGGAPAEPLRVEIFVYVLGTELDVIEQQTLSLDLDLASHREQLTSTGLKAFLRLDVAPGNHQLRVLAQAGEAFGLRGLELAAGPRASVPLPVFHELAGPWLLVAPAGVEMPLPPPFGLAAGLALPAARPQVMAGGTIPGLVFIAGDSGGLTAIVRGAGSETLEVPLTIEGQGTAFGVAPPPGDMGTPSVAVSLPVPSSLAPGLWEVAVAVAGGDQPTGESTDRSSFLPIYVEAELPPVVADVSETPSLASLGADSDPPPPSGAQRKLARAAREAYARALRQLAAGNELAAKATLMASEERVVQALDADAVGVLAEAESRVLASLADADWGCVLPVALLHLDVSRAYREGGQRILAHHATRMTIDLANAYSRHLGDPQAAAEAAWMLSSLGGYLQQRNALSQAERLFMRALELAEDDITALLGLGVLYEKRGLLDEAVPMLERLVVQRPEHAEGALRLALNRARTGKLEVAKKALGVLSERSERDWIALLAHQELARLLIDEEQPAQAADILRQGLERWSGHPTLQIQLGWVLDTQGEDDASLELLHSLGASPVVVQSAAERSRYNRWPLDVLAASRRVLDETARARRGDLERWLASQGATDGG